MGNKSSSSEPKALRPHVLRTQNNGSPRSAVILGPTGATGKFIVSYLVLSPEWSKVTIVHRREVDLDDIAQKCSVTFDELQKAKVTQHVLDMEKMCENDEVIAENAEKFKDHDVIFCVLGTTRGKAGSAENFRKVDQYMVRDGAILSKRAGIPHFSLLTSKGADAGMWANDWKISHGLLYLKVKGDAEQSVLDLKFPRTSIFRPGFLARDGNADSGFISKLDVRDLAAIILYDAETDDVPETDASDADAQAPPEKESESAVEDKKEEEKEKDTKDKVEEAVFYMGDEIESVLSLARAHYNLTCSPKTETKEEDPKGDDNAAAAAAVGGGDEKQEIESAENVEEAQEQGSPQEDAKEEPQAEPEASPAEDNDNFEVVDKPEDAAKEETTKDDGDDAGSGNDDYVAVEKSDVAKEENVEANKD